MILLSRRLKKFFSYVKNMSFTTVQFFFYVYLFLRKKETECEWGRGRERERERERETQNLKQVPGSELSAQSLMRDSNP